MRSTRFTVKPNDTSLDLLLEASKYQNTWRTHSRQINRAFREVTGLEFQQRLITARVYQDAMGYAGWPHHPMHLPADYESEQVKLVTIIHELSHRLLGGNGLRAADLGLLPFVAGDQPNLQEFEHRHMYLFEYDVVEFALGSEYAAICRGYEERNNIDSPHDRAWEWAMGMSYERRQRATRILASYAVTREHWDDTEPAPKQSAVWFAHLRGE